MGACAGFFASLVVWVFAVDLDCFVMIWHVVTCFGTILLWSCFGHVLVLGCMFCCLQRSRSYCARYVCVLAMFDGDPS